jgi:type I restriction enzyme, R subunit
VTEAKKQGVTLTGVELQADKNSVGVPVGIPVAMKPLPFLYQLMCRSSGGA